MACCSIWQILENDHRASILLRSLSRDEIYLAALRAIRNLGLRLVFEQATIFVSLSLTSLPSTIKFLSDPDLSHLRAVASRLKPSTARPKMPSYIFSDVDWPPSAEIFRPVNVHGEIAGVVSY